VAEHDDTQERTEQPTQRRIEQAREKGQLARSRELANFGLLLAGGLGVLTLGSGTVAGLAELLERGLTLGWGDGALAPAAVLTGLRVASFEALTLLAPVGVLVVAAALLAPLALGGWNFSSEALGFKTERLDPAKGLKRVFGVSGLAELIKALLKLVTIAVAAGTFLSVNQHRLLGLGRQEAPAALQEAAGLLTDAFLTLCVALALIAAVDVPYQIWHHRRQLRMSRQDLKEEYKETEGKPEVRSRIRSLQREVARRRMMQEVPRADVVVTNPSHYAVALRYAPGKMAAPRVVAKGTDLIARRIRDLAVEHAVPVVSAPPLARALHHSTRVGQEIPAGLYHAVAQVLAYVFALRSQGRGGGAAPPPPQDLPIPEELQRPA
jgi:flagellar biosynthetic protein FlhB